ncbi:hypothetical protein COT40_01925 [Candidatus Peregrinibacteria bacterium CG08_land_8_20_14_0_20_41_10]|nr:MAG: hypothetical protein COT40_01925 [Candidatus Peregrinibacteria bacterium CG08_land_8_20_14_0_20_41_10]
MGYGFLIDLINLITNQILNYKHSARLNCYSDKSGRQITNKFKKLKSYKLKTTSYFNRPSILPDKKASSLPPKQLKLV